MYRVKVEFDPSILTSPDLTVERIAAQYQMAAPVTSRDDIDLRIEGIEAMLKHINHLLDEAIARVEKRNGKDSTLDRG